MLGSREEDGVELVIVADAAADGAASGGPACWRGESSWAKLSLKITTSYMSLAGFSVLLHSSSKLSKISYENRSVQISRRTG